MYSKKRVLKAKYSAALFWITSSGATSYISATPTRTHSAD